MTVVAMLLKVDAQIMEQARLSMDETLKVVPRIAASESCSGSGETGEFSWLPPFCLDVIDVPWSPAATVFASPLSERKSYAEANLSPVGLVRFNVVNDRMRSDGIFEQAFFLANPKESVKRCIYFLYAHDAYANLEKSDRIGRIGAMVETPERLERLVQLANAFNDKDLSQEDLLSRDCETFNESIWRFCERYMPAREGPALFDGLWRTLFQPNATLLRSFGFVDNLMDATFFLRQQQDSGNSHLHAPCIMAGYQMQRDLPNHPVGTVDITEFARRSMTTDKIWDHVVNDAGGGSSVTQLRILLDLRQQGDLIQVLSNVDGDNEQAKSTSLEALVQERGPGLVSCFTVHDNFAKCALIELRSPGIHRFDGDHDSKGTFEKLCDPVQGEQERICKLWEDPPAASTDPTVDTVDKDSFESSVDCTALSNIRERFDETGTTVTNPDYHSMVLLGGYVDPHSKHWFLLQNSWKNMPLVLVSTSYLMACKASVAFLSTPLDHGPDHPCNIGMITGSSFQEHSDRKEADWPKRKSALSLL